MRRFWVAVGCALFLHLAILWLVLGRSAQKKNEPILKDLFLTFEPILEEPPLPAPPPEVPTPKEEIPPKKEVVAVATPTPKQPKIKESAPPPEKEQAPPTEAPIISEAAPPGAAPAPSLGATVGPEPNTITGKGGTFGGINLDPKAQLSLYGIGGIVDKAVPKQSKTAFVIEQLGGPLSPPVSSVIATNHKPLAMARLPFIDYVQTNMHPRIHKFWVDGALQEFQKLACDSPMNRPRDRKVVVEIVLDAKGNLERAAPIETSGESAFDAAAVSAIYDAAPFGTPPEKILSYDKKVYLHWTLHRDERQCGAFYGRAYLLIGPASEAGKEVAEAPASVPAKENKSTSSQPAIIQELLSDDWIEPPPPWELPKVREILSQMAQNCKDKVDEIEKLIKDRKFIRGFFSISGIEFPKLCKENAAMAIVDPEEQTMSFTQQLPDGPLDEISFPPCKPTCLKPCFTF